jgi:hypothetical protein
LLGRQWLVGIQCLDPVAVTAQFFISQGKLCSCFPLIDFNTDGGYYITTGSNTAPAKEHAIGKPIQLLDADKLVDMILEVTNCNDDIKNSI